MTISPPQPEKPDAQWKGLWRRLRDLTPWPSKPIETTRHIDSSTSGPISQPNPMRQIVSWYSQQESYIQSLVTVLSILFPIGCGFFSAVFPVLWSRVALATVYSLAWLFAELLTWEAIKGERTRKVAVPLVFLLFAAGAYAGWKLAVPISDANTNAAKPSATTAVGASQDDAKTLLSKRAINGLVPFLPKTIVRVGSLADEHGRVTMTIPVISILDSTVSATMYATIQIKPYIDKPLPERTAEITAEVEFIKGLTHDKYSQRHAAASITLQPSLAGDNSQESMLRIIGDKVSAKEWDDIVTGKTYIYFYIMLAVNDDPYRGTPICGVVDGLQHPPDICPPGSDPW